MRKPLILSIGLHATVLLFAVVSFPSFGERQPPAPTPLPVDLVTQAELTKIKAGEREAREDTPKVDKTPEPVKEKEADKPKPEVVKSAKAPEPKPEPKPKMAEPAPEPKPEKAEPAPKEPEPEKKIAKADPDPVPAPARKPAKPNVKPEPLVAETKPAPAPKKKDKDFDPDSIAALLNKVPDAGPKPQPRPAPVPKPEPAKGRSDGQDLAMTFNEIDALRARISQCWNPPVGGLGADAIRVKLRLRLTEQGSLSSAPEVVNREGSRFFQAAADAAVRAVMLCQPYQLPPQKYALWRDMILNFDPREMFGG